MKKKAFSLIELSIVIVIVAILIAAIAKSSKVIEEFNVKSCNSITLSSPISAIKGLALWLEPCSERSFLNSSGKYTVDDGDLIQTWFDNNPQTAFKKNFDAPDANKRPSYIAKGINSLPSIQFSHSLTRYLENTTGILSLGDSSYTIFTVARMTGHTTGVYFVYGQADSSFAVGKLSAIVFNVTQDGIGFAAGSNDNYTIAITDNVDFITTATTNGLISNVYHNSLIPTAKTLASSAANGVGGLVARVGSAPYSETEIFTGFISEIIVFDRVLESEEIEDVTKYLAKKYTIKLS
jgi:prepilin-type N-terminal cleavage/methylation domain-containing protein